MRAILLPTVVSALLAGPASAQETPPPPAPVATAPLASPTFEEPPPPAPVLRDVPPRFSWDFAVAVSYGMMTQFNAAPPFAGFGFRGGWGKHYGRSRVGAGLAVSFEGPIPIQWGNYLTPAFQWDFVHEKRVAFGASAGLDLILSADAGRTQQYEVTFDPAPMVAFRIGYSTPWSLVRNRFFILVEPKLRVVAGQPSFVGAIVIGTGRGY
jgi:hypothetical protein